MKIDHKILKQALPEIKDFSDHKKLKKVSDDMMTFMKRRKGFGLAANQVNLPLRLFIMDVVRPYRVFNPILISAEEIELGEEGCLSFPGEWLNIYRPRAINVIFYNWKGEIEAHTFRDMEARVFCHELDHLNGITFYDKKAD